MTKRACDCFVMLLAFIEICRAEGFGIPRGQLYQKEPAGNLMALSDTSARTFLSSHPRLTDAASRLQNCSSNADCDYAGCSDRGHAYGCGVAGWSGCYFVSRPTDADFCTGLCAEAGGQDQGSWASFCPAAPSDFKATYAQVRSFLVARRLVLYLTVCF